MQHVTIYREPGRYAGWPANYGIWSWGDEIVVGFTVGYADEAGGFHARDRSRPFVAMQARSVDGGETWQVEQTPCDTPGDRGILSADEHVNADLSAAQAIERGLANSPEASPGEIDFSHPDFASDVCTHWPGWRHSLLVLHVGRSLLHLGWPVLPAYVWPVRHRRTHGRNHLRPKRMPPVS